MNREDKPPLKVTFHGEGGYPDEKERAKKVLTVGNEYWVIGGDMGQSRTMYELKGVQGRFNSALFTGDIWDAPVRNPYADLMRDED